MSFNPLFFSPYVAHASAARVSKPLPNHAKRKIWQKESNFVLGKV